MRARKLLFFKASAPQSCSGKLAKSCSLKRFPEAASQSYSPKVPLQSGCPKAAMLQTCSPQRSPKLFSKAAPGSYSPKLLAKAAPQSCFLKLIPKAVVLQSNCSSMLLQSRKVAPHSSSPKLLFKVATEKLLPEAASKLVRKAVQSCYPFCKAASESCAPKLLPKVAPQSCCPKLLP